MRVRPESSGGLGVWEGVVVGSRGLVGAGLQAGGCVRRGIAAVDCYYVARTQ